MGTAELWEGVDRYFEHALLPMDPALDKALRASEAAGLPAWQVSPLQGKLLHLLAHAHGARRILEVGTLAGYSTIWLARALPPEGRLLSLEVDPSRVAVARDNVHQAGFSSQVEVRLGRALDLLPTIATEISDPFDFVFIDADKESNPQYFSWAVRLSRPGGLIVVDNVVRGGRVVDSEDPDPDVRGTRALISMIQSDPRVNATAVQTVGTKGYDGFVLAVVAPAR